MRLNSKEELALLLTPKGYNTNQLQSWLLLLRTRTFGESLDLDFEKFI